MAEGGAAIPSEAGRETEGEGGAGEQTEEQQRLLFSGMLAEEFYARHSVTQEAQFVTNSRGMRLFSRIWTPAEEDPKALICCCHGYGNDVSWMFQLNCVRFAASGYAVCALDYEGHGRSDGLRAGFRTADTIVQDCIDYFTSVRGRPQFRSLPLFLFGESLGGAIALLIISKCESEGLRDAGGQGGKEDAAKEADNGEVQALRWAGCILLSPMLRIKEEMRPHWLLVLMLKNLVYLLPDAAIVPTPDTIMLSCRDPERLKIALANPNRYAGKPRLGVAVELLRITDKMAELVPTISLPFLVVHGEADLVTDCFSSKELFAKASSQDKALKLYSGGGHQLLQGEEEGLREKVWQDVLAWLNDRIGRPLPVS